MATCKTCSGTGTITEMCSSCHGKGEIKCRCGGNSSYCLDCAGDGFVDCKNCDGNGYLTKECPTCGGSGISED